MTGYRVRAVGDETTDCKPRHLERNSSARNQQERLAEFPYRENRFRGFWGAAIVGGAVRPPVSGRSTDFVCQETSNRAAGSHLQAAPDRQLWRTTFESGMRHRPVRGRIAHPDSRQRGTAANSTLRSRAYIDTCPSRAVDTQRPHDKIKMAKRFANSIGSMVSPPLIGRFGDPMGVRF